MKMFSLASTAVVSLSDMQSTLTDIHNITCPTIKSDKNRLYETDSHEIVHLLVRLILHMYINAYIRT